MKQDIFNFDAGSKIFFTSDTHFGHANIIDFCKRPFSSVEEMDQKLIENWNNVVGPKDYIFHLGDFCFKGTQYWDKILDQLNGYKFLIIGNHDLHNLKDGTMYKFDWVGFQAYLQIEKQSIYLNHYPFLCYGGSYRESNSVWQLFGHVHSQKSHYDIEHINDPEVKEILSKDVLRLQYLFPTQYDVGVDNNDYTPVSWEQVKEKINKQVEDYAKNNQTV